MQTTPVPVWKKFFQVSWPKVVVAIVLIIVSRFVSPAYDLAGYISNPLMLFWMSHVSASSPLSTLVFFIGYIVVFLVHYAIYYILACTIVFIYGKIRNS